MMKELRFLTVLLIAILSFAAIKKKQDAVQDAVLNTQTDPVAYTQTQQEEAEGKKGPAAPAFNLFPKEQFLTEEPVAPPQAEKQTPSQEEEEFELWFDEDLGRGTEEALPADGWKNAKESAASKETSEDDWWLQEEFKLDPEEDDK